MCRKGWRLNTYGILYSVYDRVKIVRSTVARIECNFRDFLFRRLLSKACSLQTYSCECSFNAFNGNFIALVSLVCAIRSVCCAFASRACEHLGRLFRLSPYLGQTNSKKKTPERAVNECRQSLNHGGEEGREIKTIKTCENQWMQRVCHSKLCDANAIKCSPWWIVLMGSVHVWTKCHMHKQIFSHEMVLQRRSAQLHFTFMMTSLFVPIWREHFREGCLVGERRTPHSRQVRLLCADLSPLKFTVWTYGAVQINLHRMQLTTERRKT